MKRADVEAVLRRIGAPLAAFVFLLQYNLSLRAAELGRLHFINEDAALVLGARETFGPGNPVWGPFLRAYGPGFVRPWQLVGLYFEQHLLNLSAASSVVVGLVILAAALTVLAVALRPHIGAFGSAVACLLASGTAITGEPLLWLSDRHDLYLCFFFACAVASATAIMDGRLTMRAGLLLLAAAFVGAFYSNEKSAAVPAIVTGGALAFAVSRPAFTRELVRRGLLIGAVSLGSTAAYFAFRFAVLGVFIGGYNNRVTPEGGLSVSTATNLAKHALTAPLFVQFQHNKPLFALAAVSIAALVVALLVARWPNRRRAAAVALVFYGCLLSAALPTMSAFVDPMRGFGGLGPVGVLNARAFWLPHLVLSIALGVAYGGLWSLWDQPRARLVLALIAFGQIAVGAADANSAATRFGDAGEFTRSAIAVLKEHCGCADLKGGQVDGIHPLHAGVNSFTERSWLEYGAHYAGLKACAPADARCAITITANEPGTMHVNPVRRSR